MSAASLWEMAIKIQLGKLVLPVTLQEFATRLRDENDVLTLPVLDAHVFAHGTLRDVHRDPFDRMLVAQSLADGFVIVTRDSQFAAYGVPTLW